MADIDNLPSFCRSSSLEADPHTTCFRATATPAYPGGAYSNYGFIAMLGLAQRLKIDFLPITWQALLGLLGQSRATINQALLNVQTSLAFKRFNHNEADPLREIVQEMTMLGHPLVQEHPHIVQLIGICWDISTSNQGTSKEDPGLSPQNSTILKDIQIWPVLVLEKSHLGDLWHFARSGKGKGLSLEAKLKICTDVGIAVRDMHLNNVIHGDIKPQNVLVFEDKPGLYTAKVADFGFSTHFHGEQDLISIPKSVPWNAPEHHHRYFLPLGAKAMDIYSFSMLCLWLLFGVESSKTMLYPLGVANTTEPFSFKAGDWSAKEDLLLSWKRDKLLEWAIWSAAKEGRLGTEVGDRLARFFRSGLCFHPHTRTTDWTFLLGSLDPAREIPCTAILSESKLHKEEDFQIASSLGSLYLADFRLRSFILAKLEEIALESTDPRILVLERTSIEKAALQLALCYWIGFGVSLEEGKEGRIGVAKSPDEAFRRQFLAYELSDVDPDETEEGTIIITQAQNSALKKQISAIAKDEIGKEPFRVGGRFHQLWRQGFVDMIGLQYYTDQNLTSTFETVSARESRDTTWVFSHHCWLPLLLKDNLASAYRGQGRWEAAESEGKDVISSRKRKLGVDHPDTLASMANLATTYRSQSRWKAAEKIEIEIVEVRKKTLGVDHPDTLASMANLASTYRNRSQNQNLWKAAEEIDKEVLRTRKVKLGADHPDTLASMANLASTYRSQSQDQSLWEAAEEIDKAVLEARKRTLGVDHPDTLTSMANLASQYRSQSRSQSKSQSQSQSLLKAAEEIEKEVLEARKKNPGVTHYDTLAYMAYLISTYEKQGQWKAVEKLQMEVVEAHKKKSGVDDPDTLDSMANLASTYRDHGQLEAAKELEMDVMLGREEELGPNHPDTLASKANLTLMYGSQDRWKAVEKLQIEVRKISKARLRGEVPDHRMLTTMANVASMYRIQGLWKATEELQLEVVKHCHSPGAVTDSFRLAMMADLASTYRGEGNLKAAKSLEMKVMLERKDRFGVDHPDTMANIANLTLMYGNEDWWILVEKLEMRAIRRYEEGFGVDDNGQGTLRDMANLASTYRAQGKLELAKGLEMEIEELGMTIINSNKEIFGVDHHRTIAAMDSLARTYTRHGRLDAAKELQAKVTENRKKAEAIGKPRRSSKRTVPIR